MMASVIAMKNVRRAQNVQVILNVAYQVVCQLAAVMLTVKDVFVPLLQ